MSEPETVTFKTVVKIADVDGIAIREGSVLKNIKNGKRGVVTNIARAGSPAPSPFSCAGDVLIKTNDYSSTGTNRYSEWKHVPHDEQSYNERFESWLLTSIDFDEYLRASRDEQIGINGIINLLPEDAVNWEDGPTPDTIEDALRYLVIHLTEKKNEQDKV